jgi:cytosine/adenosine deaminase-related metal-dependent hydrolase
LQHWSPGCWRLEAARATESDIISIRPAQVLDVRSGKLRRDVVVQIQGERILSVDSAREIEASGVNAIDLPGLTPLPGLIDTHTHLTYDLTDDWINQAVKESLADLALRGTTSRWPHTPTVPRASLRRSKRELLRSNTDPCSMTRPSH